MPDRKDSGDLNKDYWLWLETQWKKILKED